jgi:hypothetical protein
MAGPADSLNRAVAAGWLLVGVSTGAILLLTLSPVSAGSGVSGTWSCLICGEFGTANLLRNILLFFPLGIGLGMVGVGGIHEGWTTSRILRLWLPAVALTVAIESVQAFLPGRNPLLVDVLANAAGAGLGLLLVGALLRERRPTERASPGPWPSLALVAWAVSAAILGGTAWAFQLDPPDPPHVLQVQAELGHLAVYEGRVTDVYLDEEDLEPGTYPDPEGLEARLLGGSTLMVEFEAGPPPPGIAPLFSIYTRAQREVLLLGVEGSDVVVRLPYRAANLRLDRPDHRLRRGMVHVTPGDPLRLLHAFDPVRKRAFAGPGAAGACLQLESLSNGNSRHLIREACGLRPTLGEGWQLLLFPRHLGPAVQQGISGLWLLGLGLLPGLFAGSWRAAGGVGAGLVAVGILLPWIVGSLAILMPGQGLLILAGVGLGRGARAAGVDAARRADQPKTTTGTGCS